MRNRFREFIANNAPFKAYAIDDIDDTDKKKKNALGAEQTMAANAYEYAADWAIYTGNPDPILEKKNWPFYKEITRDDTFHACTTMKKWGRLSTPWTIEAASESPEDQKIAEFVKWSLEQIAGTFRNKLEDIYTAIDYGYSISEMSYKVVEHGDYKLNITIKDIKTRDPEFIHFELDPHGNIKKIIQDVEIGRDIELARDRAIVYSHNLEFANPYGRADCQFVYKNFIAKKWIMRFWNIALERFGMGLTVAKYPRGMVDQKTALKNVLKNLQAKTSIIIPKDIEIEILNAIKGGKMAYEAAMDKHNTMMARAMLVPDLLGFSETKGGSYALGKKHFDVFLWVLEKLGKDTEETIVNEQIIKRLVDLNYSNVTKYPKFKFAPLTEDDKFEIAKIWKDLVQARAVRSGPEDEDYTRQLLGYPETPKGPDGKPIEPEPAAPEKEPAPDQAPKGPPGQPPVGEPKAVTAAPYMTIEQRYQKYAQGSTLKALKVVNFKKIARDWDAWEGQTINDLEGIMGRVEDDLLKTIQKKGLLNPNVDPDAISKLQIKYIGEYKTTLEKSLVAAHLNSKYEAAEELRKLGAPMPRRYTVLEPDISMTEALKFFKGKIPISKKDLAYYTRKAFTIAGAERDYILKDAKMLLYKNMHGENPKKTMKELRAIFDKYVQTGELKRVRIPIAGGREYELFSGYHTETVVRTNMSEAINEGRRAMFQDPSVSDFIVAYSPSAVLDDRTSDFCDSINGQVFGKDEFEFPPYHYSCRTIALPVTKGETYIKEGWTESPYKGFSQASPLERVYLAIAAQALDGVLTEARA